VTALRIKVKVFPRSSREQLIRESGLVKAYVKAAPDKGKANRALVELIAREYNVKKSSVIILKGQTGRNKVVEVLEK